MSARRILVLGSGLVAGPLVRHFLAQDGVELTLADADETKAKALMGRAQHGKALGLDVTDDSLTKKLIASSDIVFSLLPAPLHPRVAGLAIEAGKPVVNTSYVSPQMEALSDAATAAGVIVLCECGLDPGLDHMAAMQIIDRVGRAGGKITRFVSWCGGLPAPEANDNPFGYKFSWSPRGVMSASCSPARYRRDGKTVDVPGDQLFSNIETVGIPGLGSFEGYPNRDALEYLPRYGLDHVRTMFRGTLRHAGWSEAWRVMVAAGWLSNQPAQGTRMYDVFGRRDAVAASHPKIATDSALDRLEWLGVFSDENIPCGARTRPDVLNDLLQRKLFYREDERDMIVLTHELRAEYGSRAEEIRSTLIAHGEPKGASAMSRSVALPAALAGELILSGRIRTTGVAIPTLAEIYEPVLAALAKRGIAFHEESSAA